MSRFVAGALLVLAVGCSNAPSEDQCKQLLTHLVDLEFKKGGAGDATDAMKQEIAKQKAALSEKISGEFMKTCKDKIAKSRVDCTLNASTVEEVAKCDEQK
jgi:hypothetical protein